MACSTVRPRTNWTTASACAGRWTHPGAPGRKPGTERLTSPAGPGPLGRRPPSPPAASTPQPSPAEKPQASAQTSAISGWSPPRPKRRAGRRASPTAARPGAKTPPRATFGPVLPRQATPAPSPRCTFGPRSPKPLRGSARCPPRELPASPSRPVRKPARWPLPGVLPGWPAAPVSSIRRSKPSPKSATWCTWPETFSTSSRTKPEPAGWSSRIWLVSTSPPGSGFPPSDRN
jgi:hypothetical protein